MANEVCFCNQAIEVVLVHGVFSISKKQNQLVVPASRLDPRHTQEKHHAQAKQAQANPREENLLGLSSNDHC